MVTHDRYFLDRVVNEIIELDRGNLYTYKGNYSIFLERKLEREEMESAGEKKRQGILKKELAWIKKGAKARNTKQKARIDRFQKLSEQEVNIDDEKVDISLVGSRLGRKIIELYNISKSYDGVKVIDDFEYIVLRDDRVTEKIFVFEGSGKVEQYTGNYSYFKENNASPARAAVDNVDKVKTRTVEKFDSSTGEQGRKAQKPVRFSFKEQREYEEIDSVILNLEEKLEELEEKIEGAASDYTLLQQLIHEKGEAEKQLEEKMERWVYLNELEEKISRGKNE